MRQDETDDLLKRLHRAASMDRAIELEQSFSDAQLGLVAQSANRHDYPQL